ncbi:hypothetical protein [Kitasatospora sp. NPDC088779]|uniref:hypothetical protein n=1 Tax=unclassified Kitasatospora TaxID=2633591 RepID=UPI00342A9A3D
MTHHPDDVLTELSKNWVAAQPSPAIAVQRARYEFNLNFGLLGGFATKLHRFEAAIRADALERAADELERIADEAEARVAEHYGAASAIGPGSADMVREAAKTVRSMTARADR